MKRFAVAFVFLLAACSPASTTPPASSAPAASSAAASTAAATATLSADQIPTINAAVGSPIVNYGAIWVALANDLFKKNGVNVKMVSYTAFQTGPAQLAAGQIDILASSPIQSLQVAAQGKQTSVVFNVANFNVYFLAFLARTGITSMDQLKSMGSNCTIVAQPAGSGTIAYDKRVSAAYGLNCKYTQAANIQAVADAIAAGQADAGAVTLEAGLAVQKAGKGTLLIDPSKTIPDDQAKAIAPSQYPLSLFYGLKDTLQAKKESMTRFVKALKQAQQMLLKATPDQLAQWCLALSDKPFGAADPATLAASWGAFLKITPTGDNAGFISEADWKAALTGFANDWGAVNFDPAGSPSQYANEVDMSYFNAAK